MITSTKNYTKINQKPKKLERRNPKTNGKSKSIQTKSHKETYTYTLTKREKRKNIYLLKKKEESNQINKEIYQ